MSADNTVLASKSFAGQKHRNNKNRNTRRLGQKGNSSLVTTVNIYGSAAIEKRLFLLRWLPEQF